MELEPKIEMGQNDQLQWGSITRKGNLISRLVILFTTMNEEKEILSYTLILHSACEKLGITLHEYAIADSVYHL